MTEWPAVLHLDGWAGRVEYPVTVIGETQKRYRVRAEVVSFRAPSRRIVRPGDVLLVPKHAVTRDEPTTQDSRPTEILR